MGIKFNCSNAACRQRIEVDEALAGSAMKCPACATDLHIPRSKNIRFACSNPDCGQHIVVDVSESGRFAKCPACGAVVHVPGDPPKSIVPEPAKLPPTAPPASSVVETPPQAEQESAPSLLAAVVRLLLGWGLGATIFIILLLGMQLRTRLLLPRHFDALADAICGSMEFTPVEDAGGTGLFYLRVSGADLNVYRVGCETLNRTQVLRIKDTVGNPEFKWLGWSPNKLLLAYVIRHDQKDYELRVCHGETGEPQGVFEINVCGALKAGVWLNTNSLVLLNRRQGLFL